MGERFGYYTMLAILALYMQAKFGLTSSTTSIIYGSFLSLVYFLPLLGGFIADKVLGYGKTILLGILVMFTGYVLLAVPSEPNNAGYVMMFGALALIAMGTGLFKGNLQALVGNLYEADIFKNKRDIAFSIFYMFINIGAFFAPSAANSINNAILAKEHFTYDASIPKNYVKLNDKVVDKNTFIADVFKNHKKAVATQKDSLQIIDRAKKKQGVIFREDQDKALFKLKSAGLYQLTNAGMLKDSMSLSLKEYRMLESKMPEDATAKAAITEKINKIVITDPKLFGDSSKPELFASNFAREYVVKSLTKSYNWAFALACISLIISVTVFLGFRRTWKPVDKTHKQQLKEAKLSGNKADVVILTPKQVKERVIALLLVFFVVIFFWMSFHQNGLTLTFFARDYTVKEVGPFTNIFFNLGSILAFIGTVAGVVLLFNKKRTMKYIGLGMFLALGATTWWLVSGWGSKNPIAPEVFQSFNPLFIVSLTFPVMGVFTWLRNRNQEPSTPRKIGIGMIIAALGFLVILVASVGLVSPHELQYVDAAGATKYNPVPDSSRVVPYWLISSYLILTIAELFLSPMGLSFVSKVAPARFQGLMQGGWLLATAVGNKFLFIGSDFWGKLDLWQLWLIFIVCCLLSALFIFSILKRLENATK